MKIPKFLAAILAPIKPIKAPTRQQTVPGIRNQVDPRESAVIKNDRLLASTERVAASRAASGTNNVVRELVKSSPDLASSVSFMNRLGIPEYYSVVARDMDGNVSEEGTQLANSLLRRMTYLPSASGRFNYNAAIQSLSEQMAIEVQIEGAICLEVVLDEARVPSRLVPVPVRTLKIYDEKDGYRLVQDIQGNEIDLNLPTIIYSSVDQYITEAYPSSYLESAVQPILSDIDFNNDMRRVLKRAVLPRLMAVIDGDRVRKMCPPSIAADPAKFKEYKDGILAEISGVLNSANPEDAIVTYDSVEYSYLDSEADPSAIIAKIQSVLNGKLASGAKTLPSILGHNASNNTASTESMLYVKQADMIRRKINEVLSRALTVSVRIMGLDVFVEFRYDPIDLRPENELEAYATMKQSRILDLVSLGYMQDVDACITLTGNLPPKGFKPLSGTRWRDSAKPTAVGNPNSGTSVMGNALNPGTPQEPKSQK